MRFHSLGWRWSRPNDLSGPDERPVRDTFMELQRFMTWPYVGLRFDGAFNSGVLGNGPAWVTASSAASPFVAGDPYSLYRSATRLVQVPQDFDTWMLIGSATCLTTGGAAAAVLTYAWRINGASAQFMTHMTGLTGSRASLPIMTPVRKGDTIEVTYSSTDAAEDMTDGDVWMVFLPLV